jgi:hypothetical protein
LEWNWFFPHGAGNACKMRPATYVPTLLRGIAGRGNLLFDLTPDMTGLIPTCQVNMLHQIADSLVSCGWMPAIPDGVEKQLNTTKELKIIPNPSTGEINVELPDCDTYNYKITGINGQKLEEGNITGNSIRLDISVKGTFLLEVSSGNRIYTDKIIVN